jgi:hypothetical protein
MPFFNSCNHEVHGSCHPEQASRSLRICPPLMGFFLKKRRDDAVESVFWLASGGDAWPRPETQHLQAMRWRYFVTKAFSTT